MVDRETSQEPELRFADNGNDTVEFPQPPEGICIEQWRIHCVASRRLAALGGTMPEIEDIPRRKSQID